MDGEDVIIWVIGIAIVLAIVIGIPLAIIDSLYFSPIASDRANSHCEDLEFDFYEDYDRIGLLSKNPVAIRCKYVDQYRQIDLNQPLIQVK